MKKKIDKIQSDLTMVLADAEFKSESDNEATAEKYESIAEAIQAAIDDLDQIDWD